MKQKFYLTLLLILAATTVTAHDFMVDGIYYNINGSEATVTCKGYSNVQTGYYSGNITIPETVTYRGVTYAVTAIDRNAFQGCSKPTSVAIPKSVTSIANFAFSRSAGLIEITVDGDNPNYDSRDNCNAVIRTADNNLIAGCKNTIIPNSVAIIGNGAFYGCNSLASVSIPNTVTKIDVQAFAYCDGLTSVNIGSGVNYIDQGAFSCCSNLTSITVDSSNRWYDSRDNCNAIIKKNSNILVFGCQNTVIPNTVTRIGSRAFEYCSKLTGIDIPNSVTSIQDHAFLDCTGLTSVSISNSVTSIGDYAFAGCSGLSTIFIPNSVNVMGINPFSTCNGLTSITVDSNNPKFDSRDNCNAIIETASNRLICGCKNSIISITVTTIGRSAFNECSGLMSVTIPKSVTSIENYALEYCSGLTDVYSYITDLSSLTIGTSAFDLMSPRDYSRRTLHVVKGMAGAYRADNRWNPYFGQIVDDLVNGDLNGDGKVTIADIIEVADMILDDTFYASGDINGDGSLNISDINYLVSLLLLSSQQ